MPHRAKATPQLYGAKVGGRCAALLIFPIFRNALAICAWCIQQSSPRKKLPQRATIRIVAVPSRTLRKMRARAFFITADTPSPPQHSLLRLSRRRWSSFSLSLLLPQKRLRQLCLCRKAGHLRSQPRMVAFVMKILSDSMPR
jgi:hypothetical protein